MFGHWYGTLKRAGGRRFSLTAGMCFWKLMFRVPCRCITCFPSLGIFILAPSEDDLLKRLIDSRAG